MTPELLQGDSAIKVSDAHHHQQQHQQQWCHTQKASPRAVDVTREPDRVPAAAAAAAVWRLVGLVKLRLFAARMRQDGRWRDSCCVKKANCNFLSATGFAVRRAGNYSIGKKPSARHLSSWWQLGDASLGFMTPGAHLAASLLPSSWLGWWGGGLKMQEQCTRIIIAPRECRHTLARMLQANEAILLQLIRCQHLYFLGLLLVGRQQQLYTSRWSWVYAT